MRNSNESIWKLIGTPLNYSISLTLVLDGAAIHGQLERCSCLYWYEGICV